MSDQTKNFAYSTTSASVTSGATSFSVQSGHGSRFPATSGGAYNLVVWNPVYPTAAVAYQNSAAEIIRVTTLSTDTFSVITRAQEGTSAIAWGADWRVEMNVTAKNFEEASSTLSGLVSTGTQTMAGNKTFTGSVAGQGGLLTGASTATDGSVRFYNSGDSNYIDVVSPVSPSANYTLTLPSETGTVALTNKQFCILASSSRLSMSQNTTYYETFGSSTGSGVTGVNTDILRLPLPAGTIRNMRVRYQSNTVDNGSTVTLMVNGSASTLTVTCAWTVTTGSDTTHDVTITEGQEVSLRFVQPSGGSGAAVGFGVTCEFYPSAGL